MKQLVVLSGKGGTGKTSITAAFAHLAHEYSLRVVVVDADVDAANLELVLSPNVLEKHNFMGGKIAKIDSHNCKGCGICEFVCRFDAINHQGTEFQVDPFLCDGCSACFYQCPTKAISMESQLAGQYYKSESCYGPLFHADLRPAQENSGKLVTTVKQQARLLAVDADYQLLIVDGPPGIGCPVISAISGADLALIVTEPTLAGVHDMKRALELTRHFNIPTLVCINKFDIYLNGAAQIEEYCQTHNYEIVGCIPYDSSVIEAMVNGKPVTAFYPESRASKEISNLWRNLLRFLPPD
jgi:MinD superfamily P-loop ATPase